VDKEDKELEVVNKGQFLRFEFFESLVRIADMKYRQEGKCATIVESLDMLI